MAKPKPIAERTFTRRPSAPELQYIVQELAIDVPVYKTRVVDGRLELYLYSGLVAIVAPGEETIYHDLALGPIEASGSLPAGPNRRSPRAVGGGEEES